MSASCTRLGQLEGKFGVPAREYLNYSTRFWWEFLPTKVSIVSDPSLANPFFLFLLNNVCISYKSATLPSIVDLTTFVKLKDTEP